jgi:predicted kinase
MKTFQEWLDSTKILIIMRGIPGSGKSYTAKQMLEKYGGGDPHDHIFSTDDFFTQDVRAFRRDNPESDIDFDTWEKEEYRKNWNGDSLKKAHDWNFDRFKEAINNGVTPVIVDNTNTKSLEMKRYVEYGVKYGYHIIIKEPDSQWWLDHSHMLSDKKKHGRKLEDFARLLAGHHQGMSKKYGTEGNQHGVPLQVIRNMIARWQPNLTVDDIVEKK